MEDILYPIQLQSMILEVSTISAADSKQLTTPLRPDHCVHLQLINTTCPNNNSNAT